MLLIKYIFYRNATLPLCFWVLWWPEYSEFHVPKAKTTWDGRTRWLEEFSFSGTLSCLDFSKRSWRRFPNLTVLIYTLRCTQCCLFLDVCILLLSKELIPMYRYCSLGWAIVFKLINFYYTNLLVLTDQKIKISVNLSSVFVSVVSFVTVVK